MTYNKYTCFYIFWLTNCSFLYDAIFFLHFHHIFTLTQQQISSSSSGLKYLHSLVHNWKNQGYLQFLVDRFLKPVPYKRSLPLGSTLHSYLPLFPLSQLTVLPALILKLTVLCSWLEPWQPLLTITTRVLNPVLCAPPAVFWSHLEPSHASPPQESLLRPHLILQKRGIQWVKASLTPWAF